MPGREFFVKNQPDFYSFLGFGVVEMKRFDHLCVSEFQQSSK